MHVAESMAANVSRPDVSGLAVAARTWMSVALFGVAALLAGYLAYVSLSGGAVAGCGPASACQRVLQSRWAYWLRVPVAVPAVLVYAALWVGLWRHGARARDLLQRTTPRWMTVASAVVIIAAIWFLFLQAAVIRAFCPLCLAAHVFASAGAVLVVTGAIRGPGAARGRIGHLFAAGMGAFVGLIGLAAGQLLVAPRTHAVTGLGAANRAATASDRIMRLYDGKFEIDLKAFPMLGSASAPHIAVSLFDYTCSHCRSMHETLASAQRHFGDRLAIVLLPVPLDARCNHLVAHTSSENADACEYARLGLGVWRAKPEAFGTFHAALFAPARPPGVAAARAEAERLVGPEALRRALDDAGIARQLRLSVDLFAVNSRRAGVSQLPQLMLNKSLSVGPIHDADTLQAMLREEYGSAPGS